MRVGAAKRLVMSAGWAVGAYLAAVGVQVGVGGHVENSLRALVVLLAGAIYTNLFEHLWHRYGMHVRRDPRHARHHRIFYGGGVQTRDPQELHELVAACDILPELSALAVS